METHRLNRGLLENASNVVRDTFRFMTISGETLRLHWEYTIWASARVMKAASELTPEERERNFGTADKSVTGSLAHIFAADRVWLNRIQGSINPGAFISPEDRDFALLEREWAPLLERWKQWAAGLTDESVLAKVAYHDLKGNPQSTALWQIVLHVVNHGTHHRGQVSGFLRTMGKVPPALDLIAFYREKAA